MLINFFPLVFCLLSDRIASIHATASSQTPIIRWEAQRSTTDPIAFDWKWAGNGVAYDPKSNEVFVVGFGGYVPSFRIWSFDARNGSFLQEIDLGASKEYGQAITASSDGYLYAAGLERLSFSEPSHLIVMKIDSKLNRVWEKRYELTGYVYNGWKSDSIDQPIVVGIDSPNADKVYVSSTIGNYDSDDCYYCYQPGEGYILSLSTSDGSILKQAETTNGDATFLNSLFSTNDKVYIAGTLGIFEYWYKTEGIGGFLWKLDNDLNPIQVVKTSSNINYYDVKAVGDQILLVNESGISSIGSPSWTVSKKNLRASALSIDQQYLYTTSVVKKRTFKRMTVEKINVKDGSTASSIKVGDGVQIEGIMDIVEYNGVVFATGYTYGVVAPNSFTADPEMFVVQIDFDETGEIDLMSKIGEGDAAELVTSTGSASGNPNENMHNGGGISGFPWIVFSLEIVALAHAIFVANRE
ncbi:hypothetical protein ACHAXS_008299 [Conticribra weissflogii]